MGDIVALPPARQRPPAEGADARILLFTGVFREHYDDFASFAARELKAAKHIAKADASKIAANETASPSAGKPSRPAAQSSASAPKSQTKLGAARSPAQLAASAGSKSARAELRAPQKDDAAEDPLIAAIIAKVAAQAVAAAERVKATRGKSRGMKVGKPTSTPKPGAPSGRARRA
jgi:hypothetical protein